MIIPIYKPEGLTSHAVAAKLKKAFPIKPKIGHTGTLDPMVTGVLVILTDNDTKLSNLLPSDKTYKAVLKIGISTDTQDITGEVLEVSDIKPTYNQIKSVAENFIGSYMQKPPMYSAVKKNGVPLYKLARKGEVATVEAKKVTIHSLTDTKMLSDDEFSFEVSCSGGTYIRTLCDDIGKKLGIPCCMKALERIKANGFSKEQTIPLETAIELAKTSELEKFAVPYEEVFSNLPKVTFPENAVKYYMNGGHIACGRCKTETVESAMYTAFDPNGNFLGLAGAENGNFFGKWKANH